MRLPFFLFLAMLGSCKKGGGGDGTPQPLPVLTISDLSKAEGNTGTTNFGFTLSLDKAPASAVTVTYSTAEGTAHAGEDFVAATNQVVTFNAGETSKTINVAVVGDTDREGDDEFTVSITGLTGARAGNFSAKGVILNDDSHVAFTNTGYDAPTSYPGYTLSWADEFNSGALDAGAWTVEGGDGCPGLCGWGNNELEYYTGRPENLFFQDGKMIIEARKESYNGKSYTSSKLVTRGKKVFKYGRIDIRAKLPRGKGIWPAFWLLPQNNVYGNWPTSGEIDLMEMVGHEANKVYGTLHYGPGPGSTSISRGYTLPAGVFNDEFHVFSLEWKADLLKIYVDNNLFSTVQKSDIGNLTWPFNEDFFLIFNLAVGGNWPGNPDASTYFPQWLIVDYIRVYQ